jgi:hypothetical protein
MAGEWIKGTMNGVRAPIPTVWRGGWRSDPHPLLEGDEREIPFPVYLIRYSCWL